MSESGPGLTHSDMGMARGGGIVRCRACSWAVVGLARLDCQYERTRSIVRGWGREEVERILYIVEYEIGSASIMGRSGLCLAYSRNSATNRSFSRLVYLGFFIAFLCLRIALVCFDPMWRLGHGVF
jgi:hypothetical protein